MRYVGSKRRIAKDLFSVMTKYYQSKNPCFVDAFCGGCNMIEVVPHDWKRIANDKNEALIHMFVALTSGCKDFHFPKRISEKFYKTVKQSWLNGDVDKFPLYLQGFVGGVAGFRGIFFNSYAGRCVKRDYVQEGIRNLMKQIPKLRGIIFCSGDFEDLHPLPKNSLIYCDPPYKGTNTYSVERTFDYNRFYNWCRKMNELGHYVFVSEYQMPDDFSVVWEKEMTDSLSSIKSIKKQEKLFHLKK